MQKSKGTIRRERPADYAAVEQLTREAFLECVPPGVHGALCGARPPGRSRLCSRAGSCAGKGGAADWARPLYAGPAAYRGWPHPSGDDLLAPSVSTLTFRGRDMVRSYWRPPWSGPSRWAQGPCASRETLRIMAVSGLRRPAPGDPRQGTPAEDPAPYFLCKELVEGYLRAVQGCTIRRKGTL